MPSTRAGGASITQELAAATAEEPAANTIVARVETAANGAPAAAALDAAHTVVAVVGLGYVGLPTAIAMRDAGARIVGIDVSAARLRAIRELEVELLEDERAALRGYLDGDGFVLTDRIEALDAADMVLICVPTPVDARRRPDPKILRGACAAVVRHARQGQTLVLTSTTYVGTTRELLVEPLQERGLQVGEDVFVAFAPERIDPGVAEHVQQLTPRVIGAVSEQCFKRASRLLAHTCEHLHRVSSPEAAEMVKLYENTFRAVNIALAFEMAEACTTHGLDPIEITDGAASKPYGFLAHRPSAGVGGHCIGVDPHYLLHQLRERGRPATVAEEALRKVAGRPRHVSCRAEEVLVSTGRRIAQARVLVVGASYKPGVADTREAPALEIIERLLADGASVDYHDPLVERIEVAGRTLYGVAVDPRSDASGFGPEDYDLTIVVTMHPDHDYGWLARCRTVLDCTYGAHAGRERFVP
jgi:UDP-N-acetyl-D-glucosamine dehydrogenase